MGLRYYNVTPVQMALKAALDGKVRLLEAFIECEDIDVNDLKQFESFADRHMHDTFFLVYEVVKNGHVAMFEYLVDICGFELDVLEQFQDSIAVQRAAAEGEDGGVRIARDESYWHLLLRTPYGTTNLHAFAQKQLELLTEQLAAARLKARQHAHAISQQERRIAGRVINQVKYDAYVQRMTRALHDRLDAVCLPQGSVAQAKLRPVPLYDAVMKKAHAEKMREQCREEIRVCLQKIENARAMCSAVQDRVAKKSEQA